MSTASSNLYRVHGLLVESEVPLSARRASASAGAATPDYRIVAGRPRDCPYSPPPGRILAEYVDDGFASFTTEDPLDPRRRTIRYAGICDVRLDSGRRTIVVHAAAGDREEMLPIFLEGGVLAHALTADDLLPLHASAVEVDGAALAIVGPSGSGKSTLAALLCAAGSRLVTDDVLRVDVVDGHATCFPGAPGLRLRPGAASVARGVRGAALEETADGRTKVVPAESAGAPLELRAALVPEVSRRATRLEVRRLGPLEGLQELLRHPRLTAWRASEPIAQLFRLTAEVASTDLPVYRARIPWGPPFPPRLAEEILASAGLGASPRGPTQAPRMATT